MAGWVGMPFQGSTGLHHINYPANALVTSVWRGRQILHSNCLEKSIGVIVSRRLHYMVVVDNHLWGQLFFKRRLHYIVIIVVLRVFTVGNCFRH